MFLLMIYLPHILQVLYCENISINGQILEQGLAAAPALACAWRGLARLCEDEISGLFVGCRLPESQVKQYWLAIEAFADLKEDLAMVTATKAHW